MEEQAETEREQQQQQQGRAGEPKRHVAGMADQLAQHATGFARQLHVQAFRHAQVFQAHAADQHDGKSDDADQHLDMVFALDLVFLLQQEAPLSRR